MIVHAQDAALSIGPVSILQRMPTQSPADTMDEATREALIKWAHRYNRYHRLGGGPSGLVNVLRPLIEELEGSGETQ